MHGSLEISAAVLVNVGLFLARASGGGALLHIDIAPKLSGLFRLF